MKRNKVSSFCNVCTRPTPSPNDGTVSSFENIKRPMHYVSYILSQLPKMSSYFKA